MLLDVDGVIADFVGTTFRQFGLLTGAMLPDAVCTSWDVLGLPEIAPHRDLVRAWWTSENWCLRMDEYTDAIAPVCHLLGIADVEFVTTPFPSKFWHSERDEWLRRRFGRSVGVTFTHRKDRIVGDFLVDDKPKTIDEWKHGTGVLWRRPWNQTDPRAEHRDWDLLINLVESYR